MPSAILAPEPTSPTSNTTPRRRGRPPAPEAVVVRKHADAIRGCSTPVSLIAKRLGVHRATVYRWLAEKSA